MLQTLLWHSAILHPHKLFLASPHFFSPRQIQGLLAFSSLLQLLTDLKLVTPAPFYLFQPS